MSGFLTLPTTLLDRPFTYARLEVLLSEDWHDAFALTEGEKPLDLRGFWLELWCRPAFGHSTLIRTLSSAVDGGGIAIDDALNGGAMIFMAQADVVAAFVPGRWTHVLRLCEGGVDSAATARELWRGDLIVYPGN